MHPIKNLTVSLICCFKTTYLMRETDKQFDEFFKLTDTEKSFAEGDDKFKELADTCRFNTEYAEKLFHDKILVPHQQEFVKLCNRENEFFDVFGFLPPKNAPDKYLEILKKALSDIPSIFFGDELEDSFLFFVEAMKSVLFPLPEPEVETALFCEECGEELVLDDVDERAVYACPKCGKYALKSPSGFMVGNLANRNTHIMRDNAKKILAHISDLCGYSMYEIFRRVSELVGKRIRKPTDIEYLSVEEIIKIVNWESDLDETVTPLQLKNHNELIASLQAGGRLKILKSVNPDLPCGKIIIPAIVGDSALLFNSKGNSVKIALPKHLNYSFRGNVVEILHPGGTKEQYKIYPNPYKKKEDGNIVS